MKICSACGHALTPDGPCGFASITLPISIGVTVVDRTTYLCHAHGHSCFMDAGLGGFSHVLTKPLPDAADIDLVQILAMPCVMFQQEPFDFAWCETHDETFPLGDVCRYHPGHEENR